MKMENSASELLERYMKAVARRLPLSKRHDISQEIKSMILDICEERYGDSEIDSRRMESILVELGNPSKLAAKYREEKPLIGPELIPIFKLVLLIVCLVTSIVSIIDFGLNAGGMSAAESGMHFLELFSTLTSATGTIFIVFIILERLIKNKSEIDFNDDSWKIKDLPELEDKIPGRGEVITIMIFSVIFIIVLNLFFDRIGIYHFGESAGDGAYTFVPILKDSAGDLLPLFSLRLAIGAALLVPLVAGSEILRGERKHYYYQISQLGLIIFDIGILILLLSRGFESFFVAEAFKEGGITGLTVIASRIYTIVIAVLLALSGWSLIKRTLVILPKGRV